MALDVAEDLDDRVLDCLAALLCLLPDGRIAAPEVGGEADVLRLVSAQLAGALPEALQLTIAVDEAPDVAGRGGVDVAVSGDPLMVASDMEAAAPRRSNAHLDPGV